MFTKYMKELHEENQQNLEQLYIILANVLLGIDYVSGLVLSTWHVLTQMNAPPAPSNKCYHYFILQIRTSDTGRDTFSKSHIVEVEVQA